MLKKGILISLISKFIIFILILLYFVFIPQKVINGNEYLIGHFNDFGLEKDYNDGGIYRTVDMKGNSYYTIIGSIKNISKKTLYGIRLKEFNFKGKVTDCQPLSEGYLILEPNQTYDFAQMLAIVKKDGLTEKQIEQLLKEIKLPIKFYLDENQHTSGEITISYKN